VGPAEPLSGRAAHGRGLGRFRPFPPRLRAGGRPLRFLRAGRGRARPGRGRRAAGRARGPFRGLRLRSIRARAMERRAPATS
jgi:hypothetical protein